MVTQHKNEPASRVGGTKKQVAEEERISENMRMSEFVSEFVAMRGEVRAVVAKSTRWEKDGH